MDGGKNSLKDKVVIVTGAGQGIGRGIALHLAQSGMRVTIADSNEDGGNAVVGDIAAAEGQARFAPVELTDSRSIQDMIEQTARGWGRLDAIVNNARPMIPAAAFPESLRDWNIAFDVMVRAAAQMTAAAIPHFAAAGGGSVVNMSSTNAVRVSQQSLAYQVAKAALEHLTRCLAVELGPRRIRVNAVCPGLVDIPDRAKQLTADPLHRRLVEGLVPLGRAGTPDDAAQAVAWLCSNASAYVTGQILTLDGGLGLRDQFDVARKSQPDTAE